VPNFFGTAGNDIQVGTPDADIMDYSQGGDDTLHGLEGDDLFLMGAALTAADTIDGGTGNDTVVLDGDYDLTLGATTFANVELLRFFAGHDYTVSLDAATLADGVTFNVDGSVLGINDLLVFSAAAVGAANVIVNAGDAADIITTSRGADQVRGDLGNDLIDGGRKGDTLWGDGGDDTIYGGAGSDHCEGLSNNDVLYGRNGADGLWGGFGDDECLGGGGNDMLGGSTGDDILSGGAGADRLTGDNGRDVLKGGDDTDTFAYPMLLDSYDRHGDWIRDFDSASDLFDLNISVTGIDAVIMGGTLSDATFVMDIEAAVDAAHLAEHHAVVFAPDSGDFAGHVYLVVEAGGNAGFQNKHDYLIEVTGSTGFVEGNLTTGHFI
jgi:Ca2+-binding RTX toxin-like protein